MLCTSNGYEIYRCSSCCSDFVWPQPDGSEIKAYYDQASYFQGDGSGSYTNYDLDTEAVLPLFRELLQEISGGSRCSILDIGCAYGTHLAMAVEQGWDAIGIELSDHARQVAVQRLGDKAPIFESVEEVPSRAFDVITLFDVLEHLTRPYDIFEALFRRGLIGEKTVVILTTPNARSSHAVTDPTGWPYRHPPAHLFYFSAQSLRAFWAQIGVLDVEVRGVYGQDQLESATYSDEESWLNLDLKRFAGLLCIAKGFGTSIQLLNQKLGALIEDVSLSIIEQQEDFNSPLRQSALAHTAAVHKATAHLRRLNVDLIATESSRGWAEHLLVLEKKKTQQVQVLAQHMQDLLTAESAKLQVATIEMQTLQQTKWFRLRRALATRPISPGSIAGAAYLVASMMLPKPVRSVVRRMVSLPSGSTVQTASKMLPYAVLEPTPALSTRPRVVHVIANFMTGGSSRLVVDLIERLGQHYEQSVITSFVPNPPAYVGLKISELRSPKTPHTFVEHFLQLKPALIHVHYWGEVDEPWYAMAISAAETLGIPVVENVNTPVKPHFAAIVKRYVYVSDYVRKAFGRSDQAHITIYPGSDFSHFSRNTLEEESSDCVGMVYRLERDKLSEEAMLPFIAAVKKRPQTRVLVVGGGELLSVFRRAVTKAGVGGSFEFTGYLSYTDLPNAYRRMAVFVAPVWKESFGQVSAFAMNMGIPVCGYDIGAISEIVEDRSLVVPAGDAEGLANVMIRLLESPRERTRIGEQHRLRAQAYFSVEAMAKAYSGVYRELTGIPT